MAKAALIVGAGDGISASFARLLAREGMKVGLAARNTDKLAALTDEIGGLTFRCDVTAAEQAERLFAEVDDRLGALDVAHYNPSYRTQGALIELDLAEVRQALMVSAFGGFLIAQQATRACSARAAVRSCSPARRRASRAMRAPPRSRWQVRAARPRPEHGASSPRRTSTSPIS